MKLGPASLSMQCCHTDLSTMSPDSSATINSSTSVVSSSGASSTTASSASCSADTVTRRVIEICTGSKYLVSCIHRVLPSNNIGRQIQKPSAMRLLVISRPVCDYNQKLVHLMSSPKALITSVNVLPALVVWSYPPSVRITTTTSDSRTTNPLSNCSHVTSFMHKETSHCKQKQQSTSKTEPQ